VVLGSQIRRVPGPGIPITVDLPPVLMPISGRSGQDCCDPHNPLSVRSVGIEIDDFLYRFPPGGERGHGFSVELFRVLEFKFRNVIWGVALVLDLPSGPH